ncbi:MAG: helical backbone metal receptor [Bacteroidota bacterium]
MSTVFDEPDGLGRRVRLGAVPRRIVSLVPSQTELLADLGAEVVGLTRVCVHPAGWKAEKPIVGGTKNVRLDRVRDLAPDLVLANKEENVREQVEALADVCPVYVTDVPDVAASLAMIRTVGRLVGRPEAAATLADDIASGFGGLGEAGRGRRVLYLIWRDPWMSVGRDTIIADVLRRGGFQSVTDGHTRYPSLSEAEIRTLGPEAVLLSSEPYPFGEKHLDEVQALAPDAEVVLVDGEPFSWYGSRLRHTPATLADLAARLA